MNRRGRAVGVAAATVVLFLLVQLGALALVQPFDTAGMQAFEDPGDTTNSLLYLVLILVATGLMLLAFRLGGDPVVRFAILGTAGLLSWYVFQVLLPATPAVAGVSLPALLPAVAIAVALWLYPEWYVIDGAGVVMGAGAAGLFGISFGIQPAIVLLVVLAVYDAISVYGTEHMLTLAEGVMTLKVPVILVVPATLSYSYLDAVAEMEAAVEDEGNESTADDEELVADVDDGEAGPDIDDDPVSQSDDDPASPTDDGPLERDALFIGLGDAVIPTVLVASAAVFSPAPALGVLSLNAPALGAMLGTTVGVIALLWFVIKGRAHAGLPLLNGGAIVGYLLGALSVGIPLTAALGL